ncbi:hypothetical protein [Azospirillum himalayense]|uniref:Uncharacterized protein n=1 Tax=Azospirillum himalayense TaxID=654847 RepID=A0ABW0G341_9PROT
MGAKGQKQEVEQAQRSVPTTTILGIEVPHCSVDEIKKETDEAANEYKAAIGRSDRALYRLLETAYQQYLLAQADDQHQSYVNGKVKAALAAGGKPDLSFDIRAQPEKNLFYKLLSVMVPAAQRERLNHEPFHLPRADSTHALALHWAFRNKWSPEKLFDELCAIGVRAMRDEEKKKRAEGAKATAEVPPISIDAALEELGSYSTLRQASMPLEHAEGVNVGLTLMLANVKADENGKQVQLLQPIRMTPKQIKVLAQKEAKSIMIDRSEPVQILRTLQIAFRMLDRVPPKNVSVTIETTEAETLVCVAVYERSDKQWKFVLSKGQGHPEPLEANQRLSLSGEEAKRLVDTLGSDKGFSDWYIDTQEDKEAKSKGISIEQVSIIAAVDAEQGDVKEVECLLRDESHIETKPIADDWKAFVDLQGMPLSYHAWNEFVESEEKPAVSKGKDNVNATKEKMLTWSEATLTKAKVELCSNSAVAARYEWKPDEGATMLPALVQLTANIPDRLDALYETLRMEETRWLLADSYLLISGTARDIQYVVGFERKKVSQKEEAPTKPTSKRSKKS